MVRIIQDIISNGVLLVAVLILLYLIFVGGMLDVLIYPLILLIGSVILRVYVSTRQVEKDEYVEREEAKGIFVYYLVALLGIGLGNFLVTNLYRFPIEKYLSTLQVLSITDTILLAILMAISEEQFFRGELLEWLSHKMPVGMAILLNALCFTAYHFKVYGSSTESLLFVFIGGSILAYVTIRSRRLAPAQLAHITNNIGGVLFK
jgi:membrane protease YdiL (CAAX protease family)